VYVSHVIKSGTGKNSDNAEETTVNKMLDGETHSMEKLT
jgi:hypothetical protein